MLFSILLAAHIVLAILLISIILIQQGKGATAGAAFGSGASSTVFGARGSASFLTRLTAVLAALFFSNSLLLAYLYGQSTKPQSLLDQVAHSPPAAVGQSVPAAVGDGAPALPGDVPVVPASGAALPAAPAPSNDVTSDVPSPPVTTSEVPGAPASGQ